MKWEYHVLSVHNVQQDNWERALARLGDERWELIGIMPTDSHISLEGSDCADYSFKNYSGDFFHGGFYFIFKRPKN